jgi:hypothetical protein
MKFWLGVLPSEGVEHRYPSPQDVTMSRIGTLASERASVAVLMHADLVPMVMPQHNTHF